MPAPLGTIASTKAAMLVSLLASLTLWLKVDPILLLLLAIAIARVCPVTVLTPGVPTREGRLDTMIGVLCCPSRVAENVGFSVITSPGPQDWRGRHDRCLLVSETPWFTLEAVQAGTFMAFVVRVFFSHSNNVDLLTRYASRTCPLARYYNYTVRHFLFRDVTGLENKVD